MSFLQPSSPALELGVNIGHVATLRNARGTSYPDAVQAAVKQLQAEGIRVSLFIDADAAQIQAAAEAGAPVIELHTGRYADADSADEQQRQLERVRQGVLEGVRRGLKVNAGHGLHYS